MATPNASDMGQFFDFGEAAIPEMAHLVNQDVPNPTLGELHPAHLNPEAIHTAPDFSNTDFSSWLPRYEKPPHPCDYCRSKALECFIYDSDGSGRVRCSPCNALFRPCSFSDQDKMPALRQTTALDTLDVVGEDDERCFGGLTGRKQMRSLGHVGPIEEVNQGEDRPKKGAAAARFPRTAIKILKDWMLQNIDHPYPTDEEKESLKQQTGLSIGQISNWMANTRRRQKARPKRSASPSIRPSTEAIDIPAGRTWESLNPFERWKHSPPENEPAPMTAIAQAVETFDPPEPDSISSSYRRETSNNSTGSLSILKAPSISSLETGLTGISSGSRGSYNSAYSHGSRHSLGSMNSLKAKERRRRRRLPTRTPKVDLEEGPRLFQCTFCTDRFKSKYDWSRHEKSLHLSLEKWICAPLGEVIVDRTTGKRKCVYCDALEPSEEHLATHNHGACEEKGIESRTFYRKDHLRQHLRLMHSCKMTASMESWKSEAQYVKSRCGFCGQTFDKWQDRIDHLAKEFRSGADMKKWKGCRGLEPHVAIHVTSAMPPYLIANEQKSPFPFSASNSSSLKQTHLQLESKDLEYLLPNDPTKDLAIAYQGHDPSTIGPIILSTPQTYSASETPHLSPNATCWEILTLRLGRFARQTIDKHGAGSITDEMLQNEARLILYGEADGWEQTAADNPEWLNLFKKAHGIDPNAPVTGIHAHHEVYEDLGVHRNSLLDPSFNVNNIEFVTIQQSFPSRRPAFDTEHLSGTTHITGDITRTPGRQSPLTGTTSTSTTPASQTQAITTTDQEMAGIYAPISELCCTMPGGPCYGEDGEVGFATRSGDCARKKTYWLNESTAPLASFKTTSAGEVVYESSTVGLSSFSPIDEQTGSAIDDAFMPVLREQACTGSSDAVLNADDFQFPSWEELPADLQNPTTSADFHSTIPISSAGVTMPAMNITAGDQMTWDNDDMNFLMDLDVDLDLDMNVLSN